MGVLSTPADAMGWEPKVPRREGLARTLQYFRRKVGA